MKWINDVAQGKPKLIVDTNLLVPSIYSRTPLAERLVAGEFLLCLNPDIVQEVQSQIVALEKVVGLDIGIPREEVTELFDALVLWVQENNLFAPPCPDAYQTSFPDPDDRCFLWTAEYFCADFLVTGDHKLLELGNHHTTTIGTLNDFWIFLTEW